MNKFDLHQENEDTYHLCRYRQSDQRGGPWLDVPLGEEPTLRYVQRVTEVLEWRISYPREVTENPNWSP